MGRADPPSEADSLEELQELLVTVAQGGHPDRLTSMRYMALRDELFGGTSGAVLPGFLIQCVSMARFRTFIELYDGEVAERETFIHAMLTPAWRLLRPARHARFDDFLDDGF